MRFEMIKFNGTLLSDINCNLLGSWFMAEQILSQEEIDSLLGAMDSGDIDLD